MIVTAIGSDGIVMVSDSRIGMTLDNTSVVGYYDNQQKIDVVGKYVIGVAGMECYSGIFMPGICRQFIKDKIPCNSPMELAQKFANFILDTIVHRKENLTETTFIAVGYTNFPKLYVIEKNRGTDYTQKGWFCNNKDRGGNVLELETNICFKNTGMYTCEQLSKIAEQAIIDFSKRNNLEDKIGGPITVIKLDKQSKITIVKNDLLSETYFTECDFLSDFLSNKINVTYVQPQFKNDLLQKQRNRFREICFKSK